MPAVMSCPKLSSGLKPLPTRAARGPAAALPLTGRRAGLVVVASASGVPPSGPGPVPPTPTPTPPGTPTMPTNPVYLRSPGGTGGLGGAGLGGAGGVGGGGRPVTTGGPGGSGPNLPPLPTGWTLERVLFTLLGLALAVPVFNFIKRKYIDKPEPEKTIDKVTDAATSTGKHGKSAVGKAVSAVKHATVDPVRDTVAAGVQAIKHSDTGRTVQHKAEDVKDSVDIGSHDLANKAERGVSKTKKDIKHTAEDAKAKVDDTGAVLDSKGHEIKVKGSRTVQRGKEKVSDTVYEAEVAAGKTSKGLLEGLKGAATSVGRKLHVVADSTEKGGKKAADKAERGLGVKHTTGPTTSVSERRAAYYTAAGVAVGAGVLAGLYYWDKKGGDIAGKVRRLKDQTKDATNQAVGRAKDALNSTAKDVKERVNEPAGPKTSGLFGTSQ